MMSTFGIALAALGSSIPGAAAAVLGPGFTPAELLAGLGAAVVATLGVLIVRILNAPSQKPAVPAASPRPADSGVKRAA
jgi:hypothetical protein